jgi:hypothetical protein
MILLLLSQMFAAAADGTPQVGDLTRIASVKADGELLSTLQATGGVKVGAAGVVKAKSGWWLAKEGTQTLVLGKGPEVDVSAAETIFQGLPGGGWLRFTCDCSGSDDNCHFERNQQSGQVTCTGSCECKLTVESSAELLVF